MRLLRSSLLIVTLFISFLGRANNDSLWNVWSAENQPDTARAEAMQYYAWSYLFVNSDSAIYFANQELAFSKEKRLLKWVAKSYNTIGIAYMYQGKYDSSLVYLDKALGFRKILGDRNDIARSYGNMGIVYQELSNYSKAIDFFMQSLHIKEELKDSVGIANTCNNLAVLYAKIEDHDQVELYHRKSLVINQKLGNKQGVSRAYSNLGTHAIAVEDFEKAEEHLNKSIELNSEINDAHGMAGSYLSLSKLYSEEKYKTGSFSRSEQLQMALTYVVQSYEIYKSLNEPRGIITSLNQMAHCYMAIGDSKKAEAVAREAEAVGVTYQYLSELYYTYDMLYLLEQNSGNYKLALDYRLKYDAIKDSLFGQENKKAILKNEVRLIFEKKAAEDSVKNLKNQEIAQTKILAQEQLLEKESAIKYLAFGLVIIFCVSGLFIYRRYKITKKQNVIIQEQSLSIADQHTEILDSIRYAKRVQDAILPPLESIFNFFKDSFLIFQPKDVVSGDFYWFEKIGDTAFIGVADCTGHGVPGAMVSMVCSSALNKSLLEEQITSPAKILNRTRELVIENFEKSQQGLKDGMDISIMSVTYSQDDIVVVKWSGANNPLWVLKEVETDLIEIKADKQPIGKQGQLTPFTEHTLTLQKGDALFLFTDGYADQFGGPKGKKFKSKAFKSFLLNNREKQMQAQEKLIVQEFQDWKGDLEQVDDVCVFGVRL